MSGPLGNDVGVMMSEVFACPVCGEQSWEEVRTYHYERAEHDDTASRLSQYEQLRRRVLFEVWFPDADRVALRVVLCQSCGLVTYAPRPSERALDAKYAFLASYTGELGASAPTDLGRAMDAIRASRTRQAIARHVNVSEEARILDLGGGDGKLLAPFASLGARCFVVDYNVNPLPGIVRLASKLDDVDPEEKFDIVICSHVLEHVANPKAVISQVRMHLHLGGVVYAEVPREIWRGIPISGDPVTHVNFFTTESLAFLFASGGWTVVEASSVVSTYGEVAIDAAVAVAQAVEESGPRMPVRCPERARHLLAPSRRDRVGRALSVVARIVVQLRTLFASTHGMRSFARAVLVLGARLVRPKTS